MPYISINCSKSDNKLMTWINSLMIPTLHTIVHEACLRKNNVIRLYSSWQAVWQNFV